MSTRLGSVLDVFILVWLKGLPQHHNRYHTTTKLKQWLKKYLSVKLYQPHTLYQRSKTTKPAHF